MKFVFLTILVLIAIILSLNYFKKNETFEDAEQKSFCQKSADFLTKLKKYKDNNSCD